MIFFSEPSVQWHHNFVVIAPTILNRVLSRIFCLEGKSILKKFLSNAAARKFFQAF